MAAHLAESDVLLEPPGIDLQGGASWLGTFWRLPTLLRARNNPDELTLDEVLPPALLQRWERQRAVYLSGQQGINRRRPIVAADALQQRAMEIHGLELDNQIADQVSRLARRRGVTRVETTLPVALDTVNAFLDSVARQPSTTRRVSRPFSHASRPGRSVSTLRQNPGETETCRSCRLIRGATRSRSAPASFSPTRQPARTGSTTCRSVPARAGWRSPNGRCRGIDAALRCCH
jgi:hypothetical protein